MNRVSATFLLCLLFAGIAHAQTLRPRITLVNPSGGQRGTTVTFTLTGVNLGYGTQLLCNTPGLTVEAFTPEAPPANAKNPEGKITAQIKIAPDAPLGRHPFRIVTPYGPSDVGYLVVSEWPELAEKEPNNTRDMAQPLTGPITIVGRSDGGEDVDVYRVTIPKGETIVFSAAAGSIGSSLTPVLTLRDSAGQERGFGAALSQLDALLTFTAPATGDYFLFLRDLRYQGGAPFYYRLTVGKIPGVTSVFPLGGTAGTTTRLTLSGVNLPTPAESSVTMPAELPFTPLPIPGIGNQRLEVGTLPEVVEVERNDLPETAQRVTIPVTINGRIYYPFTPLSDTDCFRFTAPKGQVLSLEVVAARLGSSLDAVLSILDGKGKELASNDDARGRDAALTFTIPEDGEYIAKVTDLTGRAGETFGYRLHIAPAVPDFQLAFNPDCLAIAPGDRVQFTVTANRLNGFAEEIPFTVDGLPAGVHLLGAPVIPKGQNAVTLLATADAGTALATAPLRVTGTATINGKPVVRRAESREESYVKNNERLELTTRPVPFPFVAVTGPADLTIAADTQRLALNPGKTITFKVTVQRRADFTAKIPIVLQGLPAGITVSGNEIPEKVNEATITLKAEDNAAIGEATLTIVGRSIVDELRFTDHATLPVVLTVSK